MKETFFMFLALKKTCTEKRVITLSNETLTDVDWPTNVGQSALARVSLLHG